MDSLLNHAASGTGHHCWEVEMLGGKHHSKIVALHNRLRSWVSPMAANMQKMEWSLELAAAAEEWAAQCDSGAPPLHLSSFRHIGWNIHFSTHGVSSFTSAIDSWFNEGQHFTFSTGQCQENRTCKHYTQLVWATSSHVGCASQLCLKNNSEWNIFVCAYYPGGNWEVNGRLVRPYRTGQYCSLCTSSMSGCFKLWDHIGGLCEVPKNPCRMNCGKNGHLNVSLCKCHCNPGFTGHFCQVRCSGQCVHGHFKEEQCSCQCDIGYGGAGCSEKVQFPLSMCHMLIDEECFSISSEAATYYRAKSRCQERGGTLAHIYNQKVQDILAFYLSEEAKMTKSSDAQNFWIGLTFRPPKDSFRWDRGEMLTFSSFAFGQLNNQGFGNCVELQASSGFNWNDQRCKTHNRYICHYD
ncbi:C-type lectin domain family 18 member A-like [Periophthalmus magnuspinnatus]|uniref:C-type lectin domain family 18 member A-like n=1 Tax=Periophthalmus magnuspinnatus TaxID=409849 RepID=UPI00243692A3|nr:C-type lectin domain family 18 member A-like [Periophthalmus magnuspinnatus]